jgi:hypothetical protein
MPTFAHAHSKKKKNSRNFLSAEVIFFHGNAHGNHGNPRIRGQFCSLFLVYIHSSRNSFRFNLFDSNPEGSKPVLQTLQHFTSYLSCIYTHSHFFLHAHFNFLSQAYRHMHFCMHTNTCTFACTYTQAHAETNLSSLNFSVSL